MAFLAVVRDLAGKLWRASMMSHADYEAAAAESWHFWIGKGCVPYQAAAWLAMEDGESSFDDRAVGDGGKAFGPFQHHADRCAEIAKGCGVDIRTGTHLEQLAGAYWEASAGWYRRVFGLVMASGSLEEAVTILVTKYEQSAEPARDIARRTVMAEKWLAKFGG